MRRNTNKGIPVLNTKMEAKGIFRTKILDDENLNLFYEQNRGVTAVKP